MIRIRTGDNNLGAVKDEAADVVRQNTLNWLAVVGRGHLLNGISDLSVGAASLQQPQC